LLHRALIDGFPILETIISIPREQNIIFCPKADVYADQLGSQKIEGVHAVILEHIDNSTKSKRLLILPTTREYKKGQLVSWEWNLDLEFRQSWYLNPDTGKIEGAWGEKSKEFTGREFEAIPKLGDI